MQEEKRLMVKKYMGILASQGPQGLERKPLDQREEIGP
jgi:hypothetical protein